MKGKPFKFKNGSEAEINCPNCAPIVKLVVRTNRSTGNQFLGCPNWPECGYTTPIPEAWKMKAMGQKELF